MRSNLPTHHLLLQLSNAYNIPTNYKQTKTTNKTKQKSNILNETNHIANELSLVTNNFM